METIPLNETYLILVDNYSARPIVEEWAERGIKADIRLRRAKTPGHIVIETRDPLFASFIKKWHPECQVAIK